MAASPSKLNRRRGATPSTRSLSRNAQVQMLLMVGIVVALVLISIMLGMVLGANGVGSGSGAASAMMNLTRPVGIEAAKEKFVAFEHKLESKLEQVEDKVRQKLLRGRGASGASDTKSQEQGEIGKLGGPYPYKLEPVPETFDFTQFHPEGGDRYAEWKHGDTPYNIDGEELRKKSDEVARSRRVHVRNAMLFAYTNYEKYAFGHDELLPQSKGFHDNWGGIGTTLIDSLDTLWLMGLKEQFWRARDWVRDHLNHANCKHSVSVFETTIRSLGGLLSAFDWSHDEAFLKQAADLGERLFHAFDNPSGIPWGTVDLSNPKHMSNLGWTGSSAILAEAGTLQIEFRYLAKALKFYQKYGAGTPEDKKVLIPHDEYATKSEQVFEILKSIEPTNGLYPYFVRNSGGSQKKGPSFANNKLTFGAMADSFYEYMLKIWIQGGKVEPLYREMYDKAMAGMHAELEQKSSPTGLTFLADKNNGVMDKKMDHLVCFMGGLLALGAYTDPLGLESERAQRDLKTGKALTYTCYQMYARMATGISAEFVQFHGAYDFEIGHGAPHYLLRPEAVESFFILNFLTGDPVYREWGWEVFQAIEKFCKTDIAYGSITSVARGDGSQQPQNKMESFFLAETLKYLYLLQDPDTEVDILNKHVFNTEAHPTRIFPLLK